MKFADVYTTVLTSYPDVMSTEETALALGVSTKTVYRLLRDNKISHIKMGRTYRVPKAHLFSFLCLVSTECNSI